MSSSTEASLSVIPSKNLTQLNGVTDRTVKVGAALVALGQKNAHQIHDRIQHSYEDVRIAGMTASKATTSLKIERQNTAVYGQILLASSQAAAKFCMLNGYPGIEIPLITDPNDPRAMVPTLVQKLATIQKDGELFGALLLYLKKKFDHVSEALERALIAEALKQGELRSALYQLQALLAEGEGLLSSCGVRIAKSKRKSPKPKEVDTAVPPLPSESVPA